MGWLPRSEFLYAVMLKLMCCNLTNWDWWPETSNPWRILPELQNKLYITWMLSK